jgi:phosphatidylglycerophosphate synthase
MSGPSLAELRASGQPATVTERLNDEHWVGRLYMRRLSPSATWVFARLGWTPNAVTVCFMVCGVAAGGVVALGGLVPAAVAAGLIQVYLLLDCSDGELARWSGRTSATGVYLDSVGHYLTEAALLAGLGIAAQGRLTVSGGYVTAGVAAALLAVLVRAETDQVTIARAKSGLPPRHANAALAPRSAALAKTRRLLAALGVHRAIQAVELSLLILLAALTDSVLGILTATRVLVLACLAIAAMLVIAHLVACVASRRLT